MKMEGIIKYPKAINSINNLKEAFVKKIFVLVCMISLALACGSTRTVTRIDVDSVIDLSGKWNDTDSRLVAQEMISDCLSRVWITDYVMAEGRKPVVTVGTIRNKSSELTLIILLGQGRR